MLPILMVLWVNLHPGFVAGLALCRGLWVDELLDIPSTSTRQAAIGRLRRAWLWLALTVAATMVNPWGP